MKIKIMFLMLVLSITCLARVYAEGEAIVVTHVTGAPMLSRGGQDMAMSAGMTCQVGDELKTSDECQTDIAIQGVAGCRVLSGTSVQIMSADQKDMSVRLGYGNVILNLDKLKEGSTFKVETPTAVAAVRGTQFWGRVIPDAANAGTTFAVKTGAVDIYVKSIDKTFRVDAGYALDIPADTQELPTLRPALAEELAALAQADEVKKSA